MGEVTADTEETKARDQLDNEYNWPTFRVEVGVVVYVGVGVCFTPWIGGFLPRNYDWYKVGYV